MFRVAGVVALFAMLAVAAIILNVRADGGDVRELIAGLLVPIFLGLVSVAIVTAIAQRKQHGTAKSTR